MRHGQRPFSELILMKRGVQVPQPRENGADEQTLLLGLHHREEGPTCCPLVQSNLGTIRSDQRYDHTTRVRSLGLRLGEILLVSIQQVRHVRIGAKKGRTKYSEFESRYFNKRVTLP